MANFKSSMFFMGKVRVVINKSKKDQMGLCPLKVRVTQGGVRKEIYLPDIKVKPSNWDSTKQRLINDPMLNVRIQNTIMKLNQEINKCLAQDIPVLPVDILQKVQSGTIKATAPVLNAVEYCQSHFMKNLSLAYSTRKTYNSFIKVLKEFDPKITLDKMDVNWASRFKEFLLKEKKLGLYTINTRLKHVKSICKHAYDNKVILKYPLEGFKLSKATSNREHLSMEQLRILESIAPDGTLINTYKAFLFSCYTGLRFSDLATLTYKNILILQKSTVPEYRLQYQMSKTGKQMNVMLCQRALKMININNVGSELMVFDFLSPNDLAKSSDKMAMKIESANALANKRLKIIYQDAGIKDHLSFHCARHTFFCIALELGVDLMSLKELGGHSDLKVTQEYLKVTDTRKNEAMSKFDSI